VGQLTISAREANQQFSEILGKAEAGETVIITKRGKPVATLRPYQPEAASPERQAAWDRIIARLGTVPVPPEGEWKFNRDELYDDEDGNPRGTPKGLR
jgi:prevent-host-death family protein